ncbi:conserved hypothetical protein, partial [Ricinus communis]
RLHPAGRRIDAALDKEIGQHLLVRPQPREPGVGGRVARGGDAENAADVLVRIQAGSLLRAVLARPAALDAGRRLPHLAARAGIAVVRQQRVGRLPALPVAPQVAVDGGMGDLVTRGGMGDHLPALARLVDGRLLRHQRLDHFPGAGAQLQVFGGQQLLADHHQIGVGRQHAGVAGPDVGVQRR